MKHILCITMGDPSGIGAEIIVKALEKEEVMTRCIPVVIGDRAVLSDAISFTGSALRLHALKRPEDAVDDPHQLQYIDMDLVHEGEWTYKKVCRLSGEASFRYIQEAIAFAMAGRCAAVVTGPINKEAINLAGHHYSGHTEIFAEATGAKAYAMLLTSQSLRVIHVTTHVSMRKACDIVRTRPERIETVIRLADESMRLLGIAAPRIGVAGLNAHCSENGLFGDEEALSIAPAVERCRAEGIDVDGPIPPDTVFVKAMGGQYDVVVAMYHDQGHIPLKLSGFRLNAKTGRYESLSGVNSTVGLPIIRCSVDHGTAYGKAGEGRANEESMVEAILMAITMAEGKEKGRA